MFIYGLLLWQPDASNLLQHLYGYYTARRYDRQAATGRRKRPEEDDSPVGSANSAAGQQGRRWVRLGEAGWGWVRLGEAVAGVKPKPAPRVSQETFFRLRDVSSSPEGEKLIW